MDVRRPVCDYFAIIGYDPASGLKQERIAEFGDNLSTDCGTPVRKSPLVATYEPKVIAHFPAERPNRPFTPEIASLALPQGIRLRTEKNVPREPSFHSFVVIREDGTRIYGCSLIFFEELSSIELRQQMYVSNFSFNAQLAYLREFASGGPSTSSPNDDLSPEGLLFEHRPEQEDEMAKNCGQHRSPYHQSIAQKYTTHSLPRKFGIRIDFAKTGGAYSAVNVGGAGADPADSWREEEHVAYYKNPKSPMFISKCLAIVTPIPIIYSSENLLHNLWALINEKCPLKEYSLEDLLHWMLHELYLPAPSTLAQLSFSGFHLLLRVPPPGEMPYFDYPIETLFAHISVDQFVKLLTSFMLEQQILLISRNARNLMLIAECLSVLVFPFCWQMPYCPILPHTQLKFLEAPIPWLMGICVGEQQLPKQQLYQVCNICLLDVDSRQLEVPEDLPSFPRQHRIISEINALLSRSAAAASSQIDQKQEDGVHAFYLKGLQFNAVIRELFLDHFVSLFSTYEGYLLHAGTEHGGMVSVPKSRRKNGRMFRESTANFDKISFLVDQPESVLSFLSAFLETQV
uniref:UDENN domain-containing protein n=1 Tax=Globodera pallida TaxID=36090 RepID=A0A183BJX1_GLOPA